MRNIRITDPKSGRTRNPLSCGRGSEAWRVSFAARRQSRDRKGAGSAAWVLLAAFPLLVAAQEFSVPAEFSKRVQIDDVLARVDANQDQWVGEQDFEVFNKSLKQIGEDLKKGKREFEPLADALSRFTSLELVEFKIIESSRADDESDQAEVQARIELGGEASAGGLLSMLTQGRFSWSRADGDWRISGAELGEWKVRRAAKRWFRDVSDTAIGANYSFRRQLAYGQDYWRGELDVAVGVSVYGHHGLALGDYNGDGHDDLYISQPAGLPNLLYHNNGDGRFVDVTQSAGLGVLDDTSASLFADLDNDGDQDLLLIGPDRPLLFINDGSGHYEHRPNAGLAITGENRGVLTGAALADYDLDGDLDLYVCAYDFWESGVDFTTPTPYYDATNGSANFLFQNQGNAVFKEVTEAAGLNVNNDRFSFSPAWGDYDDDGDPDLYVANDFGRNNLYRNNGDSTFTDVAAEAGVEDLAAGMSAAWGDYDNDGDLDLYVGNMWSSAGKRITANARFAEVASGDEAASFRRHARGNSLFSNDGDGTFSDVTESSGVAMGRWAWGSDFVDLNNDGRLDLYVQNGNITGERLDDL